MSSARWAWQWTGSSPRLQLGVEVGHIHVRVVLRLGLLIHVLQRLGEILPDDGGGGHAGDWGLLPLVVDALGVLTQGELHGDRGAQDHLVHPAAVGLEGGELPGDGVGAAGTGENGGHAPLPGLLKVSVQGVHRVDGPQVRGAGVGGLVAVVGLKAQAVAKHTQVAVRVHKTRDNVAPGRVNHRTVRPHGQGGHGADGSDFAVPGGHKAVFNDKALHGVDDAVLD